jgi:tetrahydromethanopterin S-methyltransferase subunit G
MKTLLYCIACFLLGLSGSGLGSIIGGLYGSILGLIMTVCIIILFGILRMEIEESK